MAVCNGITVSMHLEGGLLWVWLMMTTPPRVLDRHHKEASELDDMVKQHMCDAEESLIMKVCGV